MKNQLPFVKKTLLEQGKISRNFCLANYISRLSGYILKLKKEGWQFETKFVKTANGEDYEYVLTSSPYRRVVYTPQGMQPIVRFEKV